MRELNPDGVFDRVEDTVEDTRGRHVGHADEHPGQFRFGHPDTAARRKPVVIGQLSGGTKHHQRMGERPLTSALRG